jgi:hypothetical protein
VTGLLHDIARAALPVAIALLVCAAAARAALKVDDEPTRRMARLYLPPLAGWCVAAATVDAAALLAGGDAGFGSVLLAIGVGAAGGLLMPAPTPSAPPPPAATPTAPPPADPAPASPLWASPEEPTTAAPRSGLWH